MFVEKSPVKLMFFWDYVTSFRYQLNYTLSNLLYYLRSRVLSNCLAFLSFFGCQKTRTNSRACKESYLYCNVNKVFNLSYPHNRFLKRKKKYIRSQISSRRHKSGISSITKNTKRFVPFLCLCLEQMIWT